MHLLRGVAILFGGALAVGVVLAWLFRQRPTWLSVAAVAVLSTWPLWVLLSQATTCTMGDDDSWAVTLALCSLIAGLAAPLLAASGDHWHRHRAVIPLLTLVPLVFHVPHLLETGLGQHHLCGSAFDSYSESGESLFLARAFYPVMWSYALSLTVLALLPLLRQRLPTSSP